MSKKKLVEELSKKGRTITSAKMGEEALGPLKLLPGTWKNKPNLVGRGWNMIALPFSEGRFKYRLLLNQYNEQLKFSIVDKGVPNRGLPADGDQFLSVIDYEQSIKQIKVADSPESGLAGPVGLDIHHEPGLWMHMLNKTTNDLDVARLATIPHGDSVLALGKSSENDGAPVIPDVNGLPIGVNQSLDNPYLDPYKHFHDNLFEGLFDPVEPHLLLRGANQGVDIVKTTKLEVDTTIETGGIVNIPFITKQANAAEMKSTFWIQELAEEDDDGNPKLRLQYLQVILLDFFGRKDGIPGLIRWPHVSINTLEKVYDDDEDDDDFDYDN